MSTTKYPKIQTIFKRDEKKKIIEKEWTLDYFEYLQFNMWLMTEKIDGTNIRIGWNPEDQFVTIDGRTENAQLPSILVNYLLRRFTYDKFSAFDHPIGLYGEGFGKGIQGKYGKAYYEGFLGGGDDKNGFILFDVKIGDYWLQRPDVIDIGEKLDIPVVPSVETGTLWDAIDLCKKGFKSKLGDITAEGVILTPVVSVCKRGGGRLIAKLKVRDFAYKGEIK